MVHANANSGGEMEPNRERVWVGLFVIVAATVLTATAVAVWGGFGHTGVPYRARFKFSGGVQPGTAVRYGGLRVGTVQRVRIDQSDTTRIEVDFVVDPGTPIKTDSVARPSSLSALSDSYIEISTGTQGAPMVPPGGVVNSAEGFSFTQIADAIESLIPQIQDVLGRLTLTLDGVQTTIGLANDLLNDNNRSNIGQALARANDLLNDHNRSNLSQLLDNFNQILNDSRPKLSTGLTNINDATGRLVPLLEDLKRTSAGADELLSHIDSLLAENRPDLRVSVSQLREVLAQSTDVMDRLQGILNQNALNIDEILENMRLSTDNIRSLTETVKRSPASLIRGINVKDRKPGEIGK
jgi:phospholipid/cholesterol/gamma-HCH transport system substrate-binding protein